MKWLLALLMLSASMPAFGQSGYQARIIAKLDQIENKISNMRNDMTRGLILVSARVATNAKDIKELNEEDYGSRIQELEFNTGMPARLISGGGVFLQFLIAIFTLYHLTNKRHA